DRDPANNYWKPRVRWRFAPVYTPLEETDVTTDYDRWNFTFGPGFTTATYDDPWYTRSTVLGLRADLYRIQQFNGAAYLGYRTDYRDMVAGAEALWDHWPLPHMQLGLNVESSLTPV